jgi:hypothetical protein
MSDDAVGKRARQLTVSTMPAVFSRIVVPPYETVWSTPQYSLAGDVVVSGVYEMSLVTLEVSTPPDQESATVCVIMKDKDVPNVNSPFVDELLVVGAKKIPIDAVSIVPSLRRLSVTVGTLLKLVVVSSVRSVGPILLIVRTRPVIAQKTHPKMPSTPVKPDA